MAGLKGVAFGSMMLFSGDGGDFAPSHDLDGTTDGIAVVFVASKTGTIDRATFVCSSVTGTSPTYVVTLETVSGQDPSGTDAGGGSATAVTGTIAAGVNNVTFTNSLSVTKGDVLCLTIRYSSGTIDASNFVSIRSGWNLASNQGIGCPYITFLTAGTWAEQNDAPSMSPRYDDGEYVWQTAVATGLNVNEWDDLDSPLYRGALWKPQLDVTIGGVVIPARLQGHPWDVHLMKNSSVTPETTLSIGAAEADGRPSNSAPKIWPFPANVSVLSTDEVRFMLEPTGSDGSNVDFRDYVMANDDAVHAVNENLYFTTASSLGTYTDYDNGSDGYRTTEILPVLTAIATSGGGGGLATPGRPIIIGG